VLVRVPIVNRLHLAIVGEVGAPKDFPVAKLKAVAQVVYPFPALPPDLLQLARWMAGYYACGLDSVIETMIPAAVRRGAALKQEKLLALARRATAEELAALHRRAPQQAKLYEFLAQQFQPPAKALVLHRRRGGGAGEARTRPRGAAADRARGLRRRLGRGRTRREPAACPQPRPGARGGGAGGRPRHG
jgi:primosomal protein N' (replication factor Y)